MKTIFSFLIVFLTLSLTKVYAQPVPTGIPAPVGFKWVPSYDEEFTQESDFNHNVWNSTDGTITLSAQNGLALQGLTNVKSGGMSSTTNIITQRFGVWEWQAKFPHNASGEANGYHTDLYLGDAAGQPYVEDDICEWNIAFTPALQCQNVVNEIGQASTGLSADFVDHVPHVGTIGDAFHTWDLLWVNDGTPHGTVSTWYDGVKQNSFALTNALFDTGMRPEMINRDCAAPGVGTGCPSSGNNPLLVKYFRVWHLVPTNLPTPTPTPTIGGTYLIGN